MAIYNIDHVEPTPPADPTSLAPAGYTETGILNGIFNSLISVTVALQNVTAAEAQRIGLVTNWQAAYTNETNQVHTFVKGTDYYSGSSSANISARAALNQLNTAYIQTLQNRQSIVSNLGKQLQSNVDQSNSAVSSMNSQAVSFIQETGTLISSTFQ